MTDALDRLDLLRLDADLSEDHRLLRDTVKDSSGTGCSRTWATGSRMAPSRPRARPRLGALGVLGMHLEGYGCAGLDARSPYGAGLPGARGRRLRAALVRLRAGLAGHVPDLEVRLARSRRSAWLPRMAAGEAIGCFGLTEPDFGSDPAGMRTRAKRDGDDWVLNGSKMWITNGSHRRRRRGVGATDDGIRGFLVPTGTPGFTAPDIHQQALAAGVGHLRARARRRPAARADRAARGRRHARAAVVPERGALRHRLGRGRRRRAPAYEAALDYAKTRVQFGQPIAGFQLTQAKLVDMAGRARARRSCSRCTSGG